MYIMSKSILAVAIIVIVAAFTSAPAMAQVSDTTISYRLTEKAVPGLQWKKKFFTQKDVQNLSEEEFRRYVYRQFHSILMEVDTLHQREYKLEEVPRVYTRSPAAKRDTTPPPPAAAAPASANATATVGDIIINISMPKDSVVAPKPDTLRKESGCSRGIMPYMGISYVGGGGSQDMWFQMPIKTDFVGFELGILPNYCKTVAPSIRLRADWATTDHRCPFVETADNQSFLNPAVFGLMAKVGVGGHLSSRFTLHGEFGYHFIRNANSDTHGWTPTVGGNLGYSWGRNLLNLNSSVGFAALGNGTDQPNQQPDGSWRRNPNDGKFRLPVNIRLDFVSAIGLGIFLEGNVQPYGWELNPEREPGQMFPEVQTNQPIRLGLSFVF